MTDRRTAAAFASLIFGLTASMTYLLERLYERLRAGKVDQRIILEQAHAMFYWRAFLAAWWGGVIALLAYGLLRGSPRRNPRSLTVAALILLPVVLLWAWRFP